MMTGTLCRFKWFVSVQLYAYNPGIPGHVPTTQYTGTLTQRTETAVDSGTEAVMAMTIAFSHERIAKIVAYRHQELVWLI